MKLSFRTEHCNNPALPPKRIVEIGRWRLMFIIQLRRGRFQWGFERKAPGAYTAGFGFGMMTALRRNANA